MFGYVKKHMGLVVVILAAALFVVPFCYSATQSVDISLSASECEELASLSLEKMNAKQREFSYQCDFLEASHDWEQQYGSLNENELVAGIVYE